MVCTGIGCQGMVELNIFTDRDMEGKMREEQWRKDGGAGMMWEGGRMGEKEGGEEGEGMRGKEWGEVWGRRKGGWRGRWKVEEEQKRGEGGDEGAGVRERGQG